MGKIILLTDEVANQIAAGEVVERPVSVVKELVDNSLDAGATEIEIRIENGGIDLIEVRDNGEGMDKDDLVKSVVRHGTSKIKSIDDLQVLLSMGFRGEALASISSVSKVMIRSRQKGVLNGYELFVGDGELSEVTVVGMPEGTIVRVENLFEKIPVRKKFLKTANTEFRYITELISHLCLGWMGVRFRLYHNSREVLFYDKVDNLYDRVKDVFGLELVRLMLEGQYDHVHWQMKSWLGKPQVAKENGNKQYLIVNGRPVSDKAVTGAIKQSMGGLLPPRYNIPWVVIINMPAEMVDVNVHPRKEEVRFVNPSSVYNAVKQMVLSVIDSNNMSFVFGEDKQLNNTIYNKDNDGDDKLRITNIGRLDGFSSSKRGSVGVQFGINKDLRFIPKDILNTESVEVRDYVSQVLPWEDLYSKKTSIIQLNNLYLVYDEIDGLVIADQHAVHERIRYEQLLVNYEQARNVGQKLLVPIEYELGVSELAVWEENWSVLENLGFAVELENNKLMIYEVPVCLATENISRVIEEVTGDLMSGGELREIPDHKLKVLTYLSCRTAIKGGTKLDQVQMQTLVDDLKKCQRPYTCPHGRPVSVKLTWKELEKMFLRTGM